MRKKYCLWCGKEIVRNNSNYCCHNCNRHDYRYKNPKTKEHRNKIALKYYHNNKDKMIELHRKWRENNRDKIKTGQQIYKMLNHGLIIERDSLKNWFGKSSNIPLILKKELALITIVNRITGFRRKNNTPRLSLKKAKKKIKLINEGITYAAYE